jgi:signal transduction histidine kinase
VAEPLRHPDESPLPACDPDLLAIAERLRGSGDAASARAAEDLEGVAERLAQEGADLRRRLFDTLSVNHDINNALVGVFGNAQLLSLGPATALPGVKDRLDVIQREANRIKQATLRISELKHALILEGRTEGRAGS